VYIFYYGLVSRNMPDRPVGFLLMSSTDQLFTHISNLAPDRLPIKSFRIVEGVSYSKSRVALDGETKRLSSFFSRRCYSFSNPG
jgi:hypothetical protein